MPSKSRTRKYLIPVKKSIRRHRTRTRRTKRHFLKIKNGGYRKSLKKRAIGARPGNNPLKRR
tara:strand:- start:366 stop:551 length:186 start_codon:yes stop_codon:yes gene_type:complete